MPGSRNLSRPVSPTAVSGRNQKRRKGQRFLNDANGLVMVGGETNCPTTGQDLGLLNGDPPPVLPPSMILPSSNRLNFPTPVGLVPGDTLNSTVYECDNPTMPLRGDPTMPLRGEHNFLSSPRNPQSVEDLVRHPSTFSAPGCTHASSMPCREHSSGSILMVNSSPPLVNGSRTLNEGLSSQQSLSAPDGTHAGNMPSQEQSSASICPQTLPAPDGTHATNMPIQEQSSGSSYMVNSSPPLANGSRSDSSTAPPSTSSAGSALEMLPRGTAGRHDPNARTLAAPPQLPPPQILRIIPGQGPKSGGIEVTFLGVGLYPGLSIMFGDLIAATIIQHGTTCMVCILPPASQACTVEVRCNHDYRGESTGRQVFFTYFDDDEIQLIKLALTILHHKTTGRTEDAGTIARKMVQHAQSQRMEQDGVSNESYGEAFPGDLNLNNIVEVETTLLKILDMIDLDDSIHRARFQQTNANGHTMLHLTASLGFLRLSAALLARGANPDMRDRSGMSSMHMASMNNHANVLRKLRSVGGDSTLRSLRGYTPYDLARSDDVRKIIAVDGHSRSSSFGSDQPQQVQLVAPAIRFKDPTEEVLEAIKKEPSEKSPQNDAVNAALHFRTFFPTNLTRPGHSSASAEASFGPTRSLGNQVGNERVIAAMAAWPAWRDQFTHQVQQIQQTFNRTFPNLPVPTFPPIPNLPGHQDSTLVRMLLGLVPQIQLPSIARDSNENEYHWWELLKGSTAPPPYEELYPSDRTRDEGVDGNTPAQLDVDFQRQVRDSERPNEIFHPYVDDKRMTPEQRRSLISAHEMKVKRLRSDRKLFFFWVSIFAVTP